MSSRVTPNKICVALALCLAFAVASIVGLNVQSGWADARDDLAAAQKAANEAGANASAAEGALKDAESAVESSAAAYDEAYAKASEAQSRVDEAQVKVNDLQSQVSQLRGRIQQLEAQVPQQREAANKALVTLYKIQQEGCSLLDMILGAENIMDFLNRIEAINRVQAVNTDKLNQMLTLQSELESSEAQLSSSVAALEEEKAQLEAQQAEAEAQRQAASAALTDAQNNRASLQAMAEAQRQAEAEAIAAANAAQEAIQMEKVPDDANTGSSAASGDSDSTIERVVSSDNANWSTDKNTFVSEWGTRINNYLAGSPLEGQGETFASAAWDYGVDPRWSPAISLVESSKGLYCFLPHNAWGWGSCSWDSWEEAINDHVRGLSRGYGYTVSIANAQKYCPPNWQHWYNTCVREMDKI